MLLEAGWDAIDPPVEALFDLWIDPTEGTNRIEDPSLAPVLADLRARLHQWMVDTDDPLLDGPRSAGPRDGVQLRRPELRERPDETSERRRLVSA